MWANRRVSERDLAKDLGMKWFVGIIEKLSRLMYWIAGIALAAIVFLTVTDVVMRRLKMPIDWTYEVVVSDGAYASKSFAYGESRCPPRT